MEEMIWAVPRSMNGTIYFEKNPQFPWNRNILLNMFDDNFYYLNFASYGNSEKLVIFFIALKRNIMGEKID